MAFCIYLRKSRADLEAEERGEGDTLARHERILLELAKRQRLNVTAIYREVVSGETIAARPEMQKLLHEVEQGCWEGVIVMEIERLARGDTIDQGIVAQTFKYSNTKIITPVKTYDPNNEFDEEYFEFGLFMSRREYKTINRRMQRGRLQSVKEGKYVGSIPPYGYVRKKLDKGQGYTLEPHLEQAEVVKLIFDLYTNEKIGASLIARRLNELGIPSYRGGVWVASSVLSILENPVYIGKIRWNWRKTVKKVVSGEMTAERPRAKPGNWMLVDGLHEPIIDISTWKAAQESLKVQNPLPIPPAKKTMNPLAGLVQCSECGRIMVRKPYKSGYPDSLICPLPGCPTTASHLYLVEEGVLQALRDWLENYKLDLKASDPDLLKSEIKVFENALKKQELELQQLEKQLSNLHDLLERGVYSVDTFLERSKALADRISSAKNSIANLQEQLHWEQSKEEGKKNIIPKIERVLEIYKFTEDPRLKNDLLKTVLEKVVYTKTVKGTKGKSSPFYLEIYPRIEDYR